MVMSSSTQQGFTLIEIMIAMTVFAILSVMTYGGLNAVLRGSERTLAYAQRLNEIQMAFTLMERDFEQIVARPARDEFGDREETLRDNETTDYEPQLIRTGWSNPRNLALRSQLQKVAYLHEEDTLYRIYWPQIDLAPQTALVNTPLLTGVIDWQVRYLSADTRQQFEEWPPLPGVEETTNYPLPVGIEVTLELEDLGELTRLYHVVQPPPR